MAAKDYIIVEGCLGTVYLAKKTKTPNLMSQDRRVITNNEIIGMFENYLRRFYDENNNDTLVITGDNGKKIFEAKLIDKDEQD